MNFWHYLRDHLIYIACWALAAWGCWLYLRGLNVAPDAVTFILIVIAAAAAAPLVIDYLWRASWYRQMSRRLADLDKQFLFYSVMEEPGFVDGQIIYAWMNETARAMNERIAASFRAVADYREYLERWVHEIKIPIAAALLTAENHPSPEMRSIQQDLQRIESYVMQILYYARSSSLEDDYIITSCSLKSLVDDALKRNARQLIHSGFSIEKDALDASVRTDGKWMGFVLDQIIQNSIKYRREDSALLRFTQEKSGESCELLVEDTGIGVSDADLPRLFHKGFTGENGRKFTKATGMGLYICANLLGKMNHSVCAEHGKDGGLRIRIRFPAGSMHGEIRGGASGAGEPG